MILYRTGEGLADHRVYVLDRLRKGQKQNSQAPVSTEEEADGKLRYGEGVHHDLLDLPSLLVQRVPVLLYADDLALVVFSPEGLQAQLDLLHAYAAKWKHSVNIDNLNISSWLAAMINHSALAGFEIYTSAWYCNIACKS